MPATSVAEYLAAQPPDRRRALEAVRKVIKKNLDRGFEEGIQYGMIGYYVPHSKYPAGYHCNPKEPLPFAALGATKSHLALHLMFVYGDAKRDSWFRTQWAKSGKKLDMGKACLRFHDADGVALDVVGELFKRMPAKEYIAVVESRLKKPRK